jgi:membrane protein implicated in regulation of membrane protease activity
MKMSAPGFAAVAVGAMIVGVTAALFAYATLVAAIVFAAISAVDALLLRRLRSGAAGSE